VSDSERRAKLEGITDTLQELVRVHLSALFRIAPAESLEIEQLLLRVVGAYIGAAFVGGKVHVSHDQISKIKG
jgi:hypothetical protein